MYVEYDNNAFPYPQTIGSTANSISGLGNADESMIDTIFIMPNKSTNPDATLMIVVDEKEPSTDPKTYQYVYVGNINDLPSDVLTESSIVNDLSTGGTNKLLSAEQGRTLNSHVNYTTCGSGASDEVKLISDDGFELSTHLRLLVKMNNTNTNSTPKFNINNTGVKDVWYNGSVASSTNTWSAGEVLDVYYDGIKYVATPNLNVDNEPTAGSNNLVKSGGVYEEVSQLGQEVGKIDDALTKNDNVIYFELGNIDSSGNDIDSIERLRSIGYIAINGSPTFMYSPTKNAAYRYYDSNKTYLGTSYSSSAEYVRIIILNTVVCDTVTITIDNVSTVYFTQKYKKTATKESLDTLNTNLTNNINAVDKKVGDTKTNTVAAVVGQTYENIIYGDFKIGDKVSVRYSGAGSFSVNPALRGDDNITITQMYSKGVFYTITLTKDTTYLKLLSSNVSTSGDITFDMCYGVEAEIKKNEITAVANNDTIFFYKNSALLAKVLSDGILYFSYQTGYYRTVYTKLSNLVDSNEYQSILIHVKKGEQYVITGTGTNTARSFATASSDGTIIRRSDNVALTNELVTIADNEDILVVNSGISSTHNLRLSTPLSDFIHTNREEISEIGKEVESIIEDFFTVIPVGTDLIPTSWRTYQSSDWWPGYYNNVGYYNAASNYISSRKSIPLNKGVYECNCGDGITPGERKWLIYDNTGTLTGTYTSGTFTITEDGARAILSTRSANLANEIKLSTYTFAIRNNTSIKVASSANNFYPKGYDFKNDGLLVSDSDLLVGYYRSNTGEFNPDGTSYRSTPKMLIPKGVILDVFCWYSENPTGINFGIHLWKNGLYVGCRTFASYTDDDSMVSKTDTLHGSLTRRYKFSIGENIFEDGDVEIAFSGETGELAYNVMLVQREDTHFLDKDVPVKSICKITKIIDFPFETTVYKNNIVTPSAAGDLDAKYVMKVNLGTDFNIRFKFRVVENLLNQNKTATIFSGVGNSITAAAVPLTQFTETFTDNGVTKTSYWPLFDGGISLLGSSTSEKSKSQNLGGYAFSIKYTGNSTDVTVENNGTSVIVKIEGTAVGTFALETYSTVETLYAALKGLTDFELDFKEINGRNSSELAIFPETKLVSEYKSNITGQKPTDSNQTIYTDAAPLFIPYAVSTKWHQAEIVCMYNNVWTCVDGITISTKNPYSKTLKTLTFGDGNQIEFKDIEFSQFNKRDAEIINYGRVYGLSTLISEVNPLFVVFEGHNVIASPSSEVSYVPDELGCTTDRIERVWERLQEKGYVPVSIEDIIMHLQNGKPLPKRCFNFMWDGYRFDNYLNIKKRVPFTSHGLKSTCAVALSETETLYLNGNEITVQLAMEIGRNYGFGFCSHSQDHLDMRSYKPSVYMQNAIRHAYALDAIGVNGEILVYPFGHYNRYNEATLDFAGYSGAIEIDGQDIRPNILMTNPFSITRLEIGLRDSLETVLGKLL